MRCLALSPHPDDIALSLGGTIASHQLEIQSIVTVFSRSLFSPYYKFDNARAVTLRRRSEDSTFAKRIRASLLDLGFPDTTLRGYPDLECIHKVRSSNKDPVFLKVQSRFRTILPKLARLVALVPLALGNHVDHRIVRDCFLLARPNSMQYFFYEDLPYASSCSESTIRRAVSKFGNSFVPRINYFTETFEKKVELNEIYSSQVSHSEVDRLRAYARLVGSHGEMGERVWVPTSQ
jgi:LmbE family N-acetylglucosaminyl deacetylase